MSDSAEASLTLGKFNNGPPKLRFVKVGPQAVGEIKLRVGGLPHKKIGQSVFPSRADDKVRVRGKPCEKTFGNIVLRNLLFALCYELINRADYFVPPAVIQGYIENERIILC